MGTEKKWLFTLFSGSLLSLILLLLYSISGFSSPQATFTSIVRHGAHYPPSFAYYIYGGRGDKDRVFRLLLAVYHPRNRYLLHLGVEASDGDRASLRSMVNRVPAVRVFGNVDVVGKPDRVNHMGSTNIASTLRAVAILLKLDAGWSWFVALSAADYPLITQDDLSHVFSSVRRDLNFIEHTSDLGWKESQRIQPIIVDPGIYLARRSQIFHATQNRPTPDAFKVFTGKVSSLYCSQWFILSRSFLEFCIFGWDNLPRILLMYFNNAVLSQESYFQSVLCNAPDFMNTTVNSDLRYMIWDVPPKMEPHFLNVSDYEQMVQSKVAFARQFKKNDPVLDMVDEKILNRGAHRVTPGAWCTGGRTWLVDPCSQWGDVNILKPGPQAKKFEETITNLMDDWNSSTNSCK
ncbi:hypothetical protein ACFE04_017633 [Oxalis oulophora]